MHRVSLSQIVGKTAWSEVRSRGEQYHEFTGLSPKMGLQICIRHRVTGVFKLVEVPFVVPLQLVDRCTAETVYACQAESLYIPLYSAFASMCKFQHSCSTADQAKQNIKAERS